MPDPILDLTTLDSSPVLREMWKQLPQGSAASVPLFHFVDGERGCLVGVERRQLVKIGEGRVVPSRLPMDEQFDGQVLKALTAQNGPLADTHHEAEMHVLQRLQQLSRSSADGGVLTINNAFEAQVLIEALDAITDEVPQAMVPRTGIHRYWLT